MEEIYSYPWHIETKYYTADIHLCTSATRTFGDEDFAASVQAFVLYFDSNEVGLEDLVKLDVSVPFNSLTPNDDGWPLKTWSVLVIDWRGPVTFNLLEGDDDFTKFQEIRQWYTYENYAYLKLLLKPPHPGADELIQEVLAPIWNNWHAEWSLWSPIANDLSKTCVNDKFELIIL